MSARQSRPSWPVSPAPNGSIEKTRFRARLEIAAPYGRTASPSWESPEFVEQCQVDNVKQMINYDTPKFTFKHGNETVHLTSDKRASLRKMANLDKFLTSVKKASQMSQYDHLPFHKISTSKKYRAYVDADDTETASDNAITFFEKEFEVIERIGFGDFAEVFKVRWRRDNNIYAVKRSIARFGSCFDNEQPQQAQLRWMDEAFYHSSLSDHPNVVECAQSWEESGYFHIQMEFMPQRLDTFVRKYPLPEFVLWNIFTDMLMALDHIHKSGYCHFDIKPENIFLDEFGVTKLGDFSLVTIPEADHNETGDARYMPLEALEAKGLNYSVDIFSLGITMLEICTDIQLAGYGTEWRALREEPLPPSVAKRIPVGMQQILRQMMSVNPRYRPSAASLLRIPPFNALVLRRKAYFLGLPFFRLQHATAELLRAGIAKGRQWIKTNSAAGHPNSTNRPVTPPPNMDFAEHALRHQFDASVQKKAKKTSPAVVLLERRNQREVDSVGNPIPAQIPSEETGVSEMLSKSFLEAMENEMGSDGEQGDSADGKDSLYSDADIPTSQEQTVSLLSMNTNTEHQEEEMQSYSDELNHVQELTFSSSDDDEDSSL